MCVFRGVPYCFRCVIAPHFANAPQGCRYGRRAAAELADRRSYVAFTIEMVGLPLLECQVEFVTQRLEQAYSQFPVEVDFQGEIYLYGNRMVVYHFCGVRVQRLHLFYQGFFKTVVAAGIAFYVQVHDY